jgi:hypothetical protein
VSTIVPLRQIRFSTHAPPEISEAAMSDLRTGEVTVRRNPAFVAEPEDRSRRDAEIFGLMMALNAEADVRAVDADAPGLDARAALAWLEADGLQDLGRIADDERLRGRFWTLFATRWALAGPGGAVFETLTRMAAEVGLLERLAFDPDDADAPIGVSKLSAQGQFRAPELSPRVATGKAADAAFVGVMNDVIGALGLSRRIRRPEEAIDPALELVAVAPYLTIAKLPQPSDDADAPDLFESGVDDEFMQLSWPHRGGPAPPSGFTAQLLPFAQRRSGMSFSSVPAVGGVAGGRAWIRIRLDDLTDPEAEESAAAAALVILQARHG